MVFYVDPCLSRSPTLDPAHATNADLILCTHAHPGHMDPAACLPCQSVTSSQRSCWPKSGAEHAFSRHFLQRMTTTDSDLRVEYFKDGLYGRVYAVPSAHPELNWTRSEDILTWGISSASARAPSIIAGDCRMYERNRWTACAPIT